MFAEFNRDVALLSWSEQTEPTIFGKTHSFVQFKTIN